jgi:hypothetical protein
MNPRAFLQRYGIDLALGYLVAAGVLIDRVGFYPLGPWAPSGWFGFAEINKLPDAPLGPILAGWMALFFPYFGPPLLLWLAARLVKPKAAKPGSGWSLPRLLLLCAAWIACIARFGALLGALWLQLGGPIQALSPTLLGWVLPFGPPLLVLAVWAWRHRRAAGAVAAA